MTQEIVSILRSVDLDGSIEEFRRRCESFSPDELNHIVNALAKLTALRKDLIILQNVKMSHGTPAPHFGRNVLPCERMALDVDIHTAPPRRLIRG